MERNSIKLVDLIELSSSADKACVAISVEANSVVGLKRIRATSSATLPLNLNDSYVREALRLLAYIWYKREN